MSANFMWTSEREQVYARQNGSTTRLTYAQCRRLNKKQRRNLRRVEAARAAR